MTRSAYTFATLEVSPVTYEEIERKLRAADYGHAFVDGTIDMHGIGLTKAPCNPATEDATERNVLRAIRALEDPQGWVTPDGGASLAAGDIVATLQNLLAERRTFQHWRDNCFIVERIERNPVDGDVTRVRAALRDYPDWTAPVNPERG